MVKLYSYIRGADIVDCSDEETEPIIESIISYGDYVLFIAEEKVGKTIFSQQLCCSLSSGEKFLDKFPVIKPCKVWYMFNEVRMGEIKNRFKCMSHGVSINTGNITLIPFKFRFNTPTGHAQLQDIINDNRENYPDVIILDALYKAVKGSLKDDNVINDFNHQWAAFAGACGKCARIVVHHLTKRSKDTDGKYFKRADSDSFGSAFLLADVDHVFRLEKYGDDPETKERVLKCDTQRSGQIIENLRLLLIEPDPLYFKEISLHTKEIQTLVKLFNKYPILDKEELIRHSKIKRSTLYKVLEVGLNENLWCKDANVRPVKYWLNVPKKEPIGLVSRECVK